MTPEHTIYALWCAWVLSWVLAMLWSNRTEKRASIAAELFFRILLYFGAILLFAFPHRATTTSRKCSFGTLAIR